MRQLVDTAVVDGIGLELYRRGDDWEIVAGDRLVAATHAAPGAERALAEMALQPWAGRDDISVLLGGLGSGRALRAILDQPGVARVDVVEMSDAIIAWEARCFAGVNGRATADPRVRIHQGELSAFLQAPRLPDLPADGWFAILLDTDEWPGWVARPGNALLYADEGMRILEEALRPGGVLAYWTATKDDDLTRRMHRRLQAVSRIAVPTSEQLSYILRGRRGPRRQPG